MKRVLVQVSEATHADWKRVASDRGVSMSEVARALIEREVVPGKRVLAVDDRAVLESAVRAKEIAARPSVVAAKVPGVSVGVRAHMRGDRPMLECPERVLPGNECPKCGLVV